MPISKELLDIASQLDKYVDYETPELDALAEAAENVGKSWSRSMLGYHSRVYYANFHVPPPGVSFDFEWGLDGLFGIPSRSFKSWVEYSFEDVEKYIREKTGILSSERSFADAEEAKEVFEKVKSSVLSIMSRNHFENDTHLKSLMEKIEASEILLHKSSIQAHLPQGKKITRDQRAVAEGQQIPPHVQILAQALSAKQPFQSCKELKKHIVTLANHTQNLEKRTVRSGRIGTHIFIGHGHSLIWRELKDFIRERLELPYDEFNRVSTAGIGTKERLKGMLDQACMAFLVLTAEDEQTDGTLHARENVIHEAGLFQGRLGFEKAIILLEEGCQEFSNIHGLGQIRFPKENIKAAFEEIRQVLEREGII